MAKKEVVCPFCGSKNIAEYLFGMPAYDEELEERLAKNEIVLGGCCIHPASPACHCNECEEDFGNYNS